MNKITVQTSAFPNELPDAIFNKTKKKLNVRREFEKYLNKHGAYDFCKMAEEIKSKRDSYSLKVYGTSSKEAYEICDYVFLESTADTLTISQFLKNVRTIPGYQMSVSENVKAKK